MQNQRIEKILAGTNFEVNSSEELKVYENNCENLVGVTEVPLGVAGPIKFGDKSYVLPLATTEAALVASINRGCKVLNLHKKLETKAIRIGTTRAPVYKVKKLKSEQFYRDWFKANFENLQNIISEQSRFTKLIKITPKKYKGLLYVKFFFDTDQAMGMNMATIACEAMNPVIEKALKAECLALSSNFCSDKKVSLVNKKEGRGFKVEAKIKISNEVIESVLKISAKKLYETYRAKIVNGSKLAKMIGANSHHANILAAIFIATGQDPAHIVEASIGETLVARKTDGLEFKVKIPCLNCGIIGGGTALPSPKKALKLLGVESSEELAKVIALAVLAGEISLLGSIAEQTLAQAHNKFRSNSKI